MPGTVARDASDCLASFRTRAAICSNGAVICVDHENSAIFVVRALSQSSCLCRLKRTVSAKGVCCGSRGVRPDSVYVFDSQRLGRALADSGCPVLPGTVEMGFETNGGVALTCRKSVQAAHSMQLTVYVRELPATGSTREKEVHLNSRD